MKIKSHQRFSIGLIAIAVLTCVLASEGKDKWQEGEAARRADYLFMEAQRHDALEKNDTYFELINRAYQLDTTQSFVGHELGFIKLLIAQEDSMLFDDGYELMKRHFDKCPGDYYSTIFYGNLNNQLRLNDEALRVWSTLDSIFPYKTDIKLKLAYSYTQLPDSTNLRKAVETYNQIEETEGRIPEISSQKAQIYMMLNDTASFINEAEEAIKASAASSSNNLYAAKIYTALKQHDKALVYLNRAIELDPTNGEAFLIRAATYQVMGNDSLYRQEIYTGLKQDYLDISDKVEIFTRHISGIFNPDPYRKEANDSTAENSVHNGDEIDPNEKKQIEALFASLIDQAPHEPSVRDLYTAYLVAINDTTGAIEQISYGVDIEPANIKRWQALMSLYLETNNYKEVIKTGEKAIRFHSKEPWILLVIGNAQYLEGDSDSSLKSYEQALELTDSADYEMRATIFTSIGDIYNSRHDIEKYAQAYEQALELNPLSNLTKNNYAYALACDEHNLDRAQALSSSVVLDEPTATYLDTYAWVLFKQKDYQNALTQIDRAIAAEKESNSAEILHHAGDIYFMNGKPKDALELWKKALSLEPGNELLKRKVKHKTYFYK